MSKKDFNGGVSPTLLKKFRRKFESNPAMKIALNAVTRGNLQEIAINRDVLNRADFSFSDEIETGEMTDQKQSGTCWLFANLNWLRTFTQEKFKIKSIEFSENYMVFWDKLEKANLFFEQIIKYIDEEPDSRKNMFLLKNPVPDGGGWHMTVNLIKKYGLVPKALMPDTTNRENTRLMNGVLYYKLREGAAELRRMHRTGKSPDSLRARKMKYLEEIHRILGITLGMPPDRFDWSYKDKDDKFHRERAITPLEFAEKYVKVDLDDVFCLINAPSSNMPYNKTFNVEFFDNIVGGDDYKWLNVPVSALKRHAVKMLKKKKAVLFGCDVGQNSNAKEGLLYDDLYDYELIFDTKMKMNKKTRLDFAQTVVTHAMVFTGVDLVDGKPVKWKVENSWGDKHGKKGYFMMSDEWFDEHVFDLAVPKEYLSPKLLEKFDQDPITLPPWSPMA